MTGPLAVLPLSIVTGYAVSSACTRYLRTGFYATLAVTGLCGAIVGALCNNLGGP